MITAWRIVKAKHAANAFDGEGARRYGGRWNTPGSPAVYTSASAALAVLEMLVHLGRGTALHAYLLIACSFDEALVARLDRSRLPAHWRTSPAPPPLQVLGDAWLRSGASAILEVPSAVMPAESNYVLNPRHAGFASVQVSPPQPFDLDVRLT